MRGLVDVARSTSSTVFQRALASDAPGAAAYARVQAMTRARQRELAESRARVTAETKQYFSHTRTTC